MISSSSTLMDSLRQHRLLTDAQLAQLPRQSRSRPGNARGFAKTLIQRGWLSVYQVNQLLEGKGHELVIGPYHVLDKLGQGGLSTVYKARHREYGNLVAIKIIKAEVFASEVGRQQFLQEVEAMARLDHPNVVQFCVADEWNDTYYFAMEYVDGTDLGKVVRLVGALPVWEACDYIRQAALGLQHAYERNLIHRDIKPVNLFLTHITEDATKAPALFATRIDPGWQPKGAPKPKPLIKILDWGLASLRSPKAAAPEPLECAATSILGTADYLSPEQARNANAVDIRGDIYSLGCSFYYLLTGQAPFPDGTLMQKILQHQQAEPTAIETFRADVPADVIAILKRMMAKDPEDRFRTPASAALALMPHVKRPRRGSSDALAALRITPTPRTRDDTPVPPTLGGRSIPKPEGDTNCPGTP
jgi:eukaryotic-like serine/threonine-protein kinase